MSLSLCHQCSTGHTVFPVAKSNCPTPPLPPRMPLGAGVVDTCQGLEWGGFGAQDRTGLPGLGKQETTLPEGAKSECSSVQSKETRSSKARQDLMGNPHNYIKCQPAFRARL